VKGAVQAGGKRGSHIGDAEVYTGFHLDTAIRKSACLYAVCPIARGRKGRQAFAIYAVGRVGRLGVYERLGGCGGIDLVGLSELINQVSKYPTHFGIGWRERLITRRRN